MPMSSERLLSHFTLWQYVWPYIRDGTSSFHLQVIENISNQQPPYLNASMQPSPPVLSVLWFHLKSHENDHWKFNGFNTEVGPNLDPKCLIMDDLFLQPVNNFSVMSGWVFCVEPVPISLRLKCLVPLLISCWHWSCPSLAIIRQANQFVRTCSLFITSRNHGLGIQYWNRVLMAKKDVICSTLAETILSS